MGVCESSKEFRLMGSASGELTVRLNSTQVYMSVGNICLRLLHPRELKIRPSGKVKLLISKDTLEC